MKILSIATSIGVTTDALKGISTAVHKAAFEATPFGVVIERPGKRSFLVPWPHIVWCDVDMERKKP